MVKFYPSLSPDLSEWCMSQPLFYIASAPRYGDHINISPKGLPSTTFSILDPNKAAYIDATGSGAETIAHLYDNGRSNMGKKRVLVSYGVDIDAVAGWLGSYGGEDSTSDISRGMFAGTVGVQRLLKLFDKYEIKATWFIPGHTLETFPED
ncbi:hypothetical protein KCU90_g4690, partial [Aureobasidium melanogenum]